jgi:hypothetical protein
MQLTCYLLITFYIYKTINNIPTIATESFIWCYYFSCFTSCLIITSNKTLSCDCRYIINSFIYTLRNRMHATRIKYILYIYLYKIIKISVTPICTCLLVIYWQHVLLNSWVFKNTSEFHHPIRRMVWHLNFRFLGISELTVNNPVAVLKYL